MTTSSALALNDLDVALRSRRAVRRFTEAPMSVASIERLIDAAVQAPSAMNLQPWAFAVANGTERLRSYSDSAKAYLLARTDVEPEAKHLLTPEINIFHGAPALIVVCATSGLQQAAEDCCLAASYLMLAAFAEGFGTCPIGFARPWLELEQTKSAIGIPANFVPVFPIVVGVAAEHPESHGRRPPQVAWL
jgi:nitroreductase